MEEQEKAYKNLKARHCRDIMYWTRKFHPDPEGQRQIGIVCEDIEKRIIEVEGERIMSNAKEGSHYTGMRSATTANYAEATRMQKDCELLDLMREKTKEDMSYENLEILRQLSYKIFLDTLERERRE
tara:strand:- start:3335 stop:3715 length:381 start_codon:yes stop_codon:yes gene_type:complete